MNKSKTPSESCAESMNNISSAFIVDVWSNPNAYQWSPNQKRRHRNNELSLKLSSGIAVIAFITENNIAGSAEAL